MKEDKIKNYFKYILEFILSLIGIAVIWKCFIGFRPTAQIFSNIYIDGIQLVIQVIMIILMLSMVLAVIQSILGFIITIKTDREQQSEDFSESQRYLKTIINVRGLLKETVKGIFGLSLLVAGIMLIVRIPRGYIIGGILTAGAVYYLFRTVRSAIEIIKHWNI